MTDNNEAYDGLSVFTYNRATLSRKNWLKQIAIERRKISHKCTEFHRATRKQGTLKLIVATLLLTYGNSATRALLLTVAYYIYYFDSHVTAFFCPYSSLHYLESLGIRPSSNVKLFMYWTEYLSIKVDPNDNSSTIDSIGLNSLHDVHGLQFTSENIVIYALGLEHERKVQRLKRGHSLVEISMWAIRTLNSWSSMNLIEGLGSLHEKFDVSL